MTPDDVDRLAASFAPELPKGAPPKPAKRGRKPPKPLKQRSSPIPRRSAPQRAGRPRKERKTTLASLKRTLWDGCRDKYVRVVFPNVCFTCSAPELAGSNWHSGHFVNAGKSLGVRYSPDNLRPQCLRCNMRAPYGLGGNQAEYAIRLLDDIGEAKFRRLMARSRVIANLTAPEARELIAALDRGPADYECAWEELIGAKLDALTAAASDLASAEPGPTPGCGTCD